jgi:hypothetical protein
MLTRLADEEWTAIEMLPPVWFRLGLLHTAGRVRMRTGGAGRRWRWEKPVLPGALR